jgi:multisubunit Na+/H+ antiporter MnhB subunit
VSTVIAVTILLTTSLVLCIAYIIEAFASQDNFIKRIASASNVILIDFTGVVVIVCVSILILLPLSIMVYQLAGFHAMLGK